MIQVNKTITADTL